METTGQISESRPEGNLFWFPAFTLWQRELARFFRQKNRVVSALLQPLIFWALLGFGLSGSFKPAGTPPGLSYAEYFYPGIVAMVLLFTAIFSTVSIIEDRNEGFLQSVLVAPAPRSAIALGKILGGSTLALIQALLFLIIAPLAGLKLSVISILLLIPILFMVAFSLTSLGFILSWRMKSIQGFHAIMMTFLMPMWLLSGAFFPSTDLPGALVCVLKLNPLTYGVAALRHAFYFGSGVEFQNMPGFALSVMLSLVFSILMFFAAVSTAKKIS